MERNLKLYRYYQIVSNSVFWGPVWILYFLSLFSLEKVLMLEAIYYISVVILELPSGYFSDRIGRRPTLIISSIAGVVANLLIVLSTSFGIFLLAQVLFAFRRSFVSGTDTSLHYDSLLSLDRTQEHTKREANAQSGARFSIGVSALVGGIVSGWSFAFAFLLSAAAQFVALCISILFSEPQKKQQAKPVMDQVKVCITRLSNPDLKWIFLFSVAMFTIVQIPAEFFQPYLQLVFLQLDWSGSGLNISPMAAGIIMVISHFLAAIALRYTTRITDKFGVKNTLLGTMMLICLIVVIMSMAIHPLILILIAFRIMPWAVSQPVILTVVNARLQSYYRATYLSMQSLSGRLALGLTLLLTSIMLGKDTAMEGDTLISILRVMGACSCLVAAILWFSAGKVFRQDPS